VIAMKGFMAIEAMISNAMAKENRHAHIAAKPSLLWMLERTGEGRFTARAFDRTRYPGEVLREIRKTGQKRECARRLAQRQRSSA
jgi:hypothetical protein